MLNEGKNDVKKSLLLGHHVPSGSYAVIHLKGSISIMSSHGPAVVRFRNGNANFGPNTTTSIWIYPPNMTTLQGDKVL
jgi:hypothetical protein